MFFCCQSGAGAAPSDAAPPQKPAKQIQPAGKSQTTAKPSPQTPSKQSAAQAALAGKTFCVASAFGHQFNVQKIGLTIFTNSLDEVAVDSWGIDDAAVKKVGQVLREILGNEFTVRRISLSKALLAELEPRERPLFRDTYNDFLSGLRAAAADAGKCDFYMTLIRWSTQYGSTNQSLVGLGIVERGHPLDQRVHLFARFLIRIHDGDSLKVLQAGTPVYNPRYNFPPSPIDGMHRQVDTTWWPAPAQAAAQSTQLKNAMRELVEQGLATKLPWMFEGS